jgi:transcriptional regulator with XRE-family HTH domain
LLTHVELPFLHTTTDGPMMMSLKMLRQRYALTQREIAAKVGVSHQRISAWEAGKGQPRLRHIPSLAAALGVSSTLILKLLERQQTMSACARPAGAYFRESNDLCSHTLGSLPRGDRRILEVLGDTWLSASAVAARLQISEAAAYRALWRQQARGLIEHRAGGGYRAKCQHP